jgi:hypothetical protein
MVFSAKRRIEKTIDPFDENTFLPHLKNMNYPYLKKVWEGIREDYIRLNIKE